MAPDRTSRPEATALRLFIAVEVPDDAKTAAAEAVAEIRARFPDARWARPENQHATLKFLGQTWPRLEGWVRERVGDAAAGAAPFELRLDGLGAFRSSRQARVVWAGLDDDPPGAMADLAGAVDLALSAEVAPERRRFSAHLTLARSDPPLALEPADLERPLRSVSWRVDHVVLFRSHLQRPAPRYEALQSFPLGLHA